LIPFVKSVASGIFILVILLGLGQGMQNGVAKEFERDASNRIVVWSQITTKKHKGLNPGRRIQLRNENYEYLGTKYADEIDKKSPRYRIGNALISYKEEPLGYILQGVSSGHQFVENQTISQGRYINHVDEENNSKVAIISNKIKREVFKKGISPIGEFLDISGIQFKIVGVYGDGGDEREEERIFIPTTTAQMIFNGGDKIHNMYFTLKPAKNFNQSVLESTQFSGEVKKYLQKTYAVAPDDERAIRVFNTLEEAKRYHNLSNNIKMFFWFVGICTIIAGVVGVGNIMLIVVKERTREIGIRKALGAKPWSIIGMILHEAIFITAVSGFTGLIVSMGLLEIFGPSIEIDYIVNPSVNFKVALTTVFILILSGAVAGFFPAWRAASIHTIDALRDE